MWEEDPRWQAAKYRFLLGGVAAVAVVSGVSSFVTGNWSYLRSFCISLGVLLGALCIYAAIIRTVALLMMLSVRVYQRFHGRDKA
jgi:hypothetical protein